MLIAVEALLAAFPRILQFRQMRRSANGADFVPMPDGVWHHLFLLLQTPVGFSSFWRVCKTCLHADVVTNDGR